jgi:hypothetical protein
MNTYARDQHRQLDRDFAEAEARDATHGSSQSYNRTDVSHGKHEQPDIARERRWRQDATVSGGQREPKVLLVKLSQRTSGKGTLYLSGWMGSARLVGFLDKEPDKNGDPVWNVYAAEPGKRP